jgi:RNA polymerase sigma-70 factor, ECF subfamily
MDNQTDRQLIEDTLLGNRQSYGLIVTRYKDTVYRYALGLLHDSSTAEDVTQTAFIKAYQNLSRLRNPDAFPSWIAVITRNCCMSLHRKNSNPTVSLDYLSEIGFEPATNRDDGGYDPELIAGIRELIPKLPPRFREILELFYYKDSSMKDIAAFLGISVSSACTRLHRARKCLLKVLEREGWL